MVSVRNYFRPVIITVLGLVLTTSACSSNGDSPDTTASATPSATATSTPSPSSSASGDSDDSAVAGSSSSGTPPTCATRDLTVAVAPSRGGGSAGSTRLSLTFTNTSGDTCVMTGWPGVSFVGGGDGKQVGVPAQRSGTPDVITLEPDARAVSDLTESDPGANGCSTPTDGFRVYPPNNKAAVFVKQAGQACADDEPLLTVEPVHPA